MLITVSKSELAHRFSKSRYARTSKNDAQDQIAKHERREHLLRRVDQKVTASLSTAAPKPRPLRNSEGAATTIDPETHHFIAQSRRSHINFYGWQYEHAGDPALEVRSPFRFCESLLMTIFQTFGETLQNHLLARLRYPQGIPNNTTFSDEDRNCVDLYNDLIYTHNIAHFNFTTYDVRRGQDIINLRPSKPGLPGKRDVMVLAGDRGATQRHPFWYARVLGIFHVEVRDTAIPRSKYRRQELLWVRWYSEDTRGGAGGWDTKRLDRVSFEPSSSPDAFGFIDPASVLRGAHIIPAFAHGRDTQGLPSTSVAVDLGGDWSSYYINRCVITRITRQSGAISNAVY